MNFSRKRIKKILINKNKNQTKKKFIKYKKKHKGKSFRNRKRNLRTNTLKKRKFAKYKRQKRKSYIKGGAKKSNAYLNKYSEVLQLLNDGGDENLEKDIFYNFDFIFDKDENIQKVIDPQTLIKEFEDGTKPEDEKIGDDEDGDGGDDGGDDDVSSGKKSELSGEADPDTEKNIEKESKGKSSAILINGPTPVAFIDYNDDAINNWFENISDVINGF
tara:strand:- start:2649 stop:3299 length:651 start_codon:yes stop_codon:yes gene_type:complete